MVPNNITQLPFHDFHECMHCFIIIAVFHLAVKRGLAVLVTCNYEGMTKETLPTCDKDAEKMKAALEALEYDVCPLKNSDATEKNVTTLLHKISDYLHRYSGSDVNEDGRKKAIIFAFSGHGELGDCIVTHHGKNLDLKDIVDQLLQSKKVYEIPKLFFIDACRGAKGGEEVPAHLVGNYRIDYATSPDFVAYAESQWMQKLASKLKDDDDSLQNLVSKVNQEVHHEQAAIQQCWSHDRLNTGPLYLRKVTMILILHAYFKYVKAYFFILPYHPCYCHFITTAPV